jgi:hypothetical protein
VRTPAKITTAFSFAPAISKSNMEICLVAI